MVLIQKHAEEAPYPVEEERSLLRRKKEQRPDFALCIVFNHGIAIVLVPCTSFTILQEPEQKQPTTKQHNDCF
jgi:hypothetical protein